MNSPGWSNPDDLSSLWNGPFALVQAVAWNFVMEAKSEPDETIHVEQMMGLWARSQEGRHAVGSDSVTATNMLKF